MKVKCPSCHAEMDLLTVLDGTAGSELMNLLAGLEPTLARPLVAYLSLFRSKARALAWDRALKLAQEVLALADKPRLSTGLAKAVEIFREKQRSESWKPLSNHNYLRKVLADLPAETTAVTVIQPTVPQRPAFRSQTAQGMAALEALKHLG